MISLTHTEKVNLHAFLHEYKNELAHPDDILVIRKLMDILKAPGLELEEIGDTDVIKVTVLAKGFDDVESIVGSACSMTTVVYTQRATPNEQEYFRH